MTENLHTIPLDKKYTWEKINLSKEVLKETIERIKKLDKDEVTEALKEYINHRPGIDTGEGTFEMMALYQRSLQLLWSDITVDALFWRQTYTILKTIQEKKLGFQWKDIDGLPGPKTTTALIEALQKEIEKPKAEVKVPEEKPKEEEKVPEEKPKEEEKVPEEKHKEEEKVTDLAITKEKKIDTFLMTEWYSKNDEWNYVNPDQDLTLNISTWRLVYTRAPIRAFGEWDFSENERRIMLEVSNILNWWTKKIKQN